jgi:hypothetical protein
VPGSFLGADDLRLLLLPVFFRALGTPFWEVERVDVFRNRLLPARCLLRDPIEVARLPLGEFGRRLDMLGATAES